MQNILFLKSKDDGPVDRMINIDLLATAHPHPDGGTKAIVGHAEINMGMPFAEFVKHVEFLISENYRIANENSIAWHNKRVKDQEETMRNVLKDMHT